MRDMTDQQPGWVIKPDMVSVYWSKEQVAQSWDIWEGDEIIAECPDEETAQRIATQARRIEELEAENQRLRDALELIAAPGTNADYRAVTVTARNVARVALLSPSSKEVQG